MLEAFMRITLKLKNIIAFSIIIGIVLISNLYNYSSYGNISKATLIVNDSMEKVNQLNELINIYEVLAGNLGDLIYNDNILVVTKQKENANRMNELITGLKATITSEEDSTQLVQLETLSVGYVGKFDEAVAILVDKKKYTPEEIKTKYNAIDIQSDVQKIKAIEICDKLKESLVAGQQASQDTAQKTIKTAQYTAIGTVILVVILGFIIAIISSNVITKNLKKLVQISNIYASGDFTTQIQIKSKDEVGDLAHAFQLMGQNLSILIQDVTSISNQLLESSQTLTQASEESSASSREVSITLSQLSEGTTSQAEAIEKTAGLMKGVNLQVVYVSEATARVTESTSKTVKVAEAGVKTSHVAAKEMANVLTAFDQTTTAIHVLGDLSSQIANIADVIKEISSQTNLLSLNASIEAARAGVHGRGFAVVADEIRKLSEQTAHSVTQVSNLSDEIATHIQHAVSTIQKGNTQVHTGVESVEQAEAAFQQILAEFQDVAHQINQMAIMITEIEGAARATTAEMDGIAAIIEESAASSQEVTAISQQQSQITEDVTELAQGLSELGNHLILEVQKFKI